MRGTVCRIGRQIVPICAFAQLDSRWQCDPNGSLPSIGRSLLWPTGVRVAGVAELDYQANHNVAGNEGEQWVVLMGQFGWKWWVARLESAHNGWS
jgi:hypothetical protein